MRALCRLTVALVLLAAPAWGQGVWQRTSGTISTAGTTCATATNCVTLTDVTRTGGGTIVLTGTFVGTAQFEGSLDGTTWFALSVFPQGSTVAVTSTTATGQWSFPLALVGVRVRASALTSGSITVAMVATSARGAGGSGGAPSNATYVTTTAEAGLTSETALGSLTTGLLLNTVAAGVGTPSAYAGATCTNQFVTALDASGGATCTTSTLAGAQYANQGTTTTVLHGAAAGNPSWAAVHLTNDVTGALATGQTVTAGTGSGAATLVGVLNAQSSAAGIGNNADLTDDVLFTYTLPANSLSANNKGVRITAWGNTAANPNNKRFQITFGGTAVMTQSNAINNNPWHATATVLRTSASAQTAFGLFSYQNAGSQTTLTAPAIDTTGTIVITVTGASYTTGAANDVTARAFIVEMLN